MDQGSAWRRAVVLALAAGVTTACFAGCAVDAVVGVAGDAGGDVPNLLPPGETKDAASDPPQFLAGPTCAGPTGCPENAYCWISNGCPSDMVRGSCAFIPSHCATTDAPVCGCDGKTYKNACLANTARTAVLHDGKCP